MKKKALLAGAAKEAPSVGTLLQLFLLMMMFAVVLQRQQQQGRQPNAVAPLAVAISRHPRRAGSCWDLRKTENNKRQQRQQLLGRAGAAGGVKSSWLQAPPVQLSLSLSSSSSSLASNDADDAGGSEVAAAAGDGQPAPPPAAAAAILAGLVRKAGFDEEEVELESISSEGSFCNAVYAVHQKRRRKKKLPRGRAPGAGGTNGSSEEEDDDSDLNDAHPVAVAKVFSQLSLSRMSPSLEIGAVERMVSDELGLGPKLLSSSSRGIVVDVVSGGGAAAAMTEGVLHGRDASRECHAIGVALARLHYSVPQQQQQGEGVGEVELGENGYNMLWRSCEAMLKMMQTIASATEAADRRSAIMTLFDRLRRAVGDQKRFLSTLELPLVAMGHGDFKPANVMIVRQQQQPATSLNDDEDDDSSSSNTPNHIFSDWHVQLIDLELAGTNYRGFDLAKIFRTEMAATAYTELNQQAFFEAYAAEANKYSTTNVTVEALRDEARHLLPMTWLEASIFFACMAADRQDDAEEWARWSELAAARLRRYEGHPR